MHVSFVIAAHSCTSFGGVSLANELEFYRNGK